MCSPLVHRRPSIAKASGGIERAAASPAMARQVLAAVAFADAWPALTQLRVSTLVLHRDREFVPVEEAIALAAAIPGADPTVVPGVLITILGPVIGTVC